MAVTYQMLLVISLVSVLFANLAAAKLVETPPLVLDYHNGPVLAGPKPISLYLILYGRFSNQDQAALTDFISSLTSPSTSLSRWWSLTRKYTDTKGQGVSQQIHLANQLSITKNIKKSLQRTDIAALVLDSVRSKKFPTDPSSVYMVFTASDVSVQGFCQSTCGEHMYTMLGSGVKLPYAWVGNSESQCPGFCAWPYAKPQFGPQEVLKAPNGVGVDGMIITMAKVLAGAATNPFGTAYFQGQPTFAYEAAGACGASYGPGSYPGYPGDLLVDPVTKASYNVEGVNGRKFLVPWMWNPVTRACAVQP